MSQVQLDARHVPGAWKEAGQATFLLLDVCVQVYIRLWGAP